MTQWVPIILIAVIGIPMGLLVNYLIWFELLPMTWRMNRETFRRIRERRNSN